MSRVRVVRDLYIAYETGDRARVEHHLSDDFVFSAPPGLGIDRARYFERCWPNARAIAAFEYHRLIEACDEVVVIFEATRTDGRRFRKPQAEGAPC
jgi:ketosteroid isomerase-like protein